MSDWVEVWWVRHGESDSNAGARTASAAAPVLTELGWRQARATAESFDRPPDRIVTSPYVRTQQTARPLLERFPGVPHEEWAVQEFTELSYQNRNHTSGAERLPLLEEYWSRLEPDYLDGDGAESFRGLIDRVDAALGRAQALPPGLTVVFSHGLFMRAMLWRMFAQPGQAHLSQPQRIDQAAMRRYSLFHDAMWIPNCAVVRMTWTGRRWYVSPPDVGHLGGVTVTKANESEA